MRGAHSVWIFSLAATLATGLGTPGNAQDEKQRDAEIAQLQKDLADLKAQEAANEARFKQQESVLEAKLNSLAPEGQPTPTTPKPAGSDESAVEALTSTEPQNAPTVLAQGSRLALNGAPPAPADRSLNTGGLSSLEISATNAGGTATITVSSDPRQVVKGNWLLADTAQLSFSAPTGSGSGEMPIADLNALASGAELKLSWSRYRRQIGLGELTTQQSQQIQKAQASCTADKAANQQPTAPCLDPDQRLAIMRKYDAADVPALLKTISPGRFSYDYGLSGGVGYQQYTFANSTTVKNVTVSKVPIEGEIYASILPNSIPSSLTLSFNFQYAYKAQKAGVVCPTQFSATKPSFSCLSGPVGAPAQSDQELIALEYRQWLGSLPVLGPVAASVQATYDFHSRASAIDLPIYFVSDTKGNLIGGFRLGYSTQDHFVAGLVVNAPFSIFQQ